jgi:hypothetical protein
MGMGFGQPPRGSAVGALLVGSREGAKARRREEAVTFERAVPLNVIPDLIRDP